MIELEKRFEYIVNTSSDFITLINREYCYELVNESYIKNIQIPRDKILGHHVKDIWGEELFNKSLKKYLDQCLNGEEVHYVDRFEFGPTWKYMHVSYYPYREEGKISHILVFSHDITRLGEIEAKLINYEFRDPMTGLFNGRSLNVILEMELEKAVRMKQDNLRALLIVSITNLQDIQLTHSHSTGNMLLENTGQRIKDLVRETDYVFHYEGNELVILLSCLNEEYGPAVVAKKIHEMVTIPYRSGDYDISMNCYIGISLFPKDGETPETLIESASEALRRALEEKKPYAMYDRQVHDYAVNRLKLESDMIRAFEKEQFDLNYQPIVDANGYIKGCETLIRWEHPEKGLIPPSDFIPLAEKNGLIVPIGKWVIFKTIRNMKDWNHKYPIYTSINLTAREFEDNSLLEILQTALKQASMESPGMIRLECTESMEMLHPDVTVEKMRNLYNAGFEIFLDDFGTGFSSLSYLKNLPASTLKLDKIFIDKISYDEESRKFLRLIIHLAENLDMKLIIEGVETEEQFTLLKEEGCTLFQGYYFSKPLPKKELDKILETGRPLPF